MYIGNTILNRLKFRFSLLIEPKITLNLTIRASLAPSLKLFFSRGPKGPHMPAEGFVTIFPQLSAEARENPPRGRCFSSCL